ncbi:protein of unknown function [Pseudonocardia thermophila]|uniref:Uncharacterized protein n=1 Tax=Pseudonocardia thermophila TaxID=1848 RepID=A0A1M6QLT3_PSETH|nr:DUF2017 domain-containing protein [Pseudonocardia thermophila]SHK21138.1 protein of unknown function [Pseudonocardia thermophila]
MKGWKKTGRGDRQMIVGDFDPQEAAVLRGLLREVRQMLEGRAAEAPDDELAEITGIRLGPTKRPADRIVARLLPDFTFEDPDLAAGLRSLHEPQLIAAKLEVNQHMLDTLPPDGGRVELRPEAADEWLTGLNDIRLALGTALDVSEDMPDELPPDDPRAEHMGVYQWLTFVQDSLVHARMAVREKR